MLINTLNAFECLFIILVSLIVYPIAGQRDTVCPTQEIILPCRCSQRENEIQIWCSHSDLTRVLGGLKAVAKSMTRPIDELILENNFLPSLPGRAFAGMQIARLMLRYNSLERLSTGWLNDIGDMLVEIYIVERDLQNVPMDSLIGLHRLEAVTIQSEKLTRAPDFSGLDRLRYINVQSSSLVELSAQGFRDLNNLENIHIIGSKTLTRVEAGLFQDLPRLNLINLSDNGIKWIHLRAFSRLPQLKVLQLSGNAIDDAGMVGRAIKDISNLEMLKLDHNIVSTLGEGSFVELPSLRELLLNDNQIMEIHYGAFHRTPNLKVVHLENNFLRKVHPESFLQASGSGVEVMHLQHNHIARIEEMRSLLDALPMLRFLDLSNNKLEAIPFGALRGHGTLEQLHLNHNRLRVIDRDGFMAMPGLRELRLKNNSLSDVLPMPFWNLPNLKGLDLSENNFRVISPNLLLGLPSLRRLDVSNNYLTAMDPSALTNTMLLETVNISRNEIGLIHPATFRHLNRLFEIDAGHNKLIEIIPGLPAAVERVSVEKNRIQHLPHSPNKDLNLPNLRMLNLADNILQRLPRSAFKTMPQLRTLNLAKNRLQTIDENTLLGLNRLETFNLQDNRIIALHERSTLPLENLREMNLQGNRVELLTDQLFDNCPNLEKLDVSRNNIVEIAANSFRKIRSLQSIDLSNNALRDLPDSLATLSELKEIDVSFNQLTKLSPQILAMWRNLEELKASNNKISELKQSTFRNLPLLQYLDLSSNELSQIEQGSIRNLPELQELVLADNKLIELTERVFEDLPSLQAVHLQENNLRAVSPYAFYRSPSIVYLNFSTNHFRALDNIGLRSVRNVEVLDLSNNEIRRLVSSPLRGLDWLVELKLDDNRICAIQGEPFSSMPRLRVLSMRNNKMSMIPESTFRNLRENIAVFDIEGNPIECGCEMLWYRSWLQESDSHFPGPRCRDGTMLREARISRNECQQNDGRSSGSNHVPILTNEHGDVFSRRMHDDCLNDIDGNIPGIGLAGDLPPSPEESEYFYDQYIDYPNPINDTFSSAMTSNSSIPINVSTNTYDLGNNTGLAINANANLIDFNRNKFNFVQNQPPNNSPFTFFGVPVPSLNIGKLWSGAGAGRSASNRAAIGTRGKGRVQIYRPGDPEISHILNRTEQQSQDPYLNDDPEMDPQQEQINNSPSDENQIYYRPHFQTPFIHVEQGGFTPMIPEMTGGFTPIHPDQTKQQQPLTPPYDHISTSETFVNKVNDSYWPEDDAFQELVPIVYDRNEKKKLAATTESIRISQFSDYRKNYVSTTESELNGFEATTKSPTTTSRPTTTTDAYKEATNFGSPTIFFPPTKTSTTTTTTSTSTTTPEQETTTAPTTTTTTALPIFTVNNKLSNKQMFPEETPLPNFEENTSHKPLTIPPSIVPAESGIASNFPIQHIKDLNPEIVHVNPYADGNFNLGNKKSHFWENHSPSSLSALVAPGAQQGIYKVPPNRGTIQKVQSPSQLTKSATSVPGNMANEAQFLGSNEATEGSSSNEEGTVESETRRHQLDSDAEIFDNHRGDSGQNGMDWYFASYNKTPVYDVYEPGPNSYKSRATRLEFCFRIFSLNISAIVLLLKVR